MNLISFYETVYQGRYDLDLKKSYCGRIFVPHIFGKLICMSIRDMYLFLFFLIPNSLKLGLRMSKYNNSKKTYIMMHHTLTTSVIILVKYHQQKMIKFKLLVQVQHSIKIFTNFQIICFRKLVSNFRH